MAMAELTLKDLEADVHPDWCPGCGDFGVLKSIKEAIIELRIPPHEVLIVSGIGCSSNLPGFIRAYGVHSLHGRAVPVATGAALARFLALRRLDQDGRSSLHPTDVRLGDPGIVSIPYVDHGDSVVNPITGLAIEKSFLESALPVAAA